MLHYCFKSSTIIWFISLGQDSVLCICIDCCSVRSTITIRRSCNDMIWLVPTVLWLIILGQDRDNNPSWLQKWWGEVYGICWGQSEYLHHWSWRHTHLLLLEVSLVVQSMCSYYRTIWRIIYKLYLSSLIFTCHIMDSWAKFDKS